MGVWAPTPEQVERASEIAWNRFQALQPPMPQTINHPPWEFQVAIAAALEEHANSVVEEISDALTQEPRDAEYWAERARNFGRHP